MLADIQKGMQANDAGARSAALDSLISILEDRGHELSPEKLDEFADVLTQMLRALPSPYADQAAARLTAMLVSKSRTVQVQSETATPDFIQITTDAASAPEPDGEPSAGLGAGAPSAPMAGPRADDAMPQNDSAQNDLVQIDLAQIDLARDDTAMDAASLAAILSTHVAPILAEAAQPDARDLALSVIHQDMLDRAVQPDLDAMTTHMIVSRGNDAARVAVARNSSAQFARSSLTTLAELAISDLSLKDALVARRDLPEGIADRLWPFLSERGKITLLTARRNDALDDFEALAQDEDSGSEGLSIDAMAARIDAQADTIGNTVGFLCNDGRLVTAALLLARSADIAPICAAHAVLSPAERPLVILLKAVEAGPDALRDLVRLRARCGIGASKDSRFAAIVMEDIPAAEAKALLRMMSDRLEDEYRARTFTPHGQAHAA